MPLGDGTTGRRYHVHPMAQSGPLGSGAQNNAPDRIVGPEPIVIFYRNPNRRLLKRKLLDFESKTFVVIRIQCIHFCAGFHFFYVFSVLHQGNFHVRIRKTKRVHFFQIFTFHNDDRQLIFLRNVTKRKADVAQFVLRRRFDLPGQFNFSAQIDGSQRNFHQAFKIQNSTSFNLSFSLSLNSNLSLNLSLSLGPNLSLSLSLDLSLNLSPNLSLSPSLSLSLSLSLNLS